MARFVGPFSAPDPLADGWDEMVRQNWLLQSKNDPLANPGDGLPSASDGYAAALNRSDLPIGQWMALRDQQFGAGSGASGLSAPGFQEAPISDSNSPALGGAGDDALAGGQSGDVLAMADDARGRVMRSLFDGGPPTQAPKPPKPPTMSTTAPANSSTPKPRLGADRHVTGPLLGLISEGEGTNGPNGYDAVYGAHEGRDGAYPTNTKTPSELTLDEWIALEPTLTRLNGGAQ